jgi:hypothetical protein
MTSQSDRDEVYTALYKFILSSPCEMTSAEEVVQKALTICYLKECLGALELAIWKAMCLVQAPPIAVADLHLWVEWCRLGWKVHNGPVRHRSSLAIIMSSVIPFVDQSEKNGHYPSGI